MEKINESAGLHIAELRKFLRSAMVDIQDEQFMRALKKLQSEVHSFLCKYLIDRDFRALRYRPKAPRGLNPRDLSKAAKDRLRCLVRAVRAIERNLSLPKAPDIKRLMLRLKETPHGTDHGLDEYVQGVSDRPWNADYAVGQLLYLIDNTKVLSNSAAVSTMLIELGKKLVNQ